MPRSDQEIIKQTNELARRFYLEMGYVVKDTYLFYRATHPQEVLCWRMACIAQEKLTNTDAQQCLDEQEE